MEQIEIHIFGTKMLKLLLKKPLCVVEGVD
jgi:hypothetical protein